MSLITVPRPNHGMEHYPEQVFPSGKSRQGRITDLDLLLCTPTLEEPAPALDITPLPLPGLFTALRVCLLADCGLLLAAAVIYGLCRAMRVG